MNQVIKNILLLAIFSINLILAACGGGGGSSGAAADHVSINGTTYTANGSTVTVGGYLVQTSPYVYQYGGPVGVIQMDDTHTGNSLYFQVVSTVDGWPGTYNHGGGTFAYIKDISVGTGGDMLDLADGSGTGGPITINSFGAVGQPVTGNFNLNLCDSNTNCSSSIKNYTGAFSVNRTANVGSLAIPVLMPIPTSSGDGILPATGKNYYTVPTNATSGVLTITLTPTVDVNMAVFTNAGFTTPATCDVTNHLNIIGSNVETCAITVAANQKIYLTVSQIVTATAPETYTISVSE